MIGHCEYCGEKLSNDGRVDTRFCSDEHRIKFHNDKRRVKNLYNKALKAITELQEIYDTKDRHYNDALTYLIRLNLRLKTDEKSNP